MAKSSVAEISAPYVCINLPLRWKKLVYVGWFVHATSKLNMAVLKCLTRYFLIKFAL